MYQAATLMWLIFVDHAQLNSVLAALHQWSFCAISITGLVICSAARVIVSLKRQFVALAKQSRRLHELW